VRANKTDISVNPSYPIASGHPSPADGTTLLLLPSSSSMGLWL